MKKILIRVESYKNSGLGGMETRIKDFISVTKNHITILSNRELDTFFNKKIIYINYNNIYGIFKDIFTFRKYNIIESNGHRDNLIAIINYLIYFPFYKIKKIKLFIVIHGIIGIESNKGFQKIIYNIIINLGIIISNKIIVVSKESEFFLLKKYQLFNKSLNNKIEIIPNYIKTYNLFNKIKRNNIKKAIIVSRLDNSKIKGVINSINFCNKFNIKLHIYGGGDKKDELEKKYKNIIFYGEIKNTDINYNNYEIIIGMGRALLEGLSKNLIGILVGYEKIICDINLFNIKHISFSNFSGRGIKKINSNIIYKNVLKSVKNKNYISVSNQIINNYSLENFKDYWK